MKNKRYLGNGVYASQLELALVLTTENGVGRTNTIVLDPHVLSALFDYLQLKVERKAKIEEAIK
jgi:hypothetical protein